MSLRDSVGQIIDTVLSPVKVVGSLFNTPQLSGLIDQLSPISTEDNSVDNESKREDQEKLP